MIDLLSYFLSISPLHVFKRKNQCEFHGV